MSEEKEDIVDIVLRDAEKNHHVKVNQDDPNIKALVSYALTVGYANGWRDRKEWIEKNET